jgi:uncharacterized protein (DUF2236 family)
LQGIGAFKDGENYSANHEGAIIWVWATLVETSVFIFQMIVRKLSEEELVEYYEDQKIFLRYFGVRPEAAPHTWSDFVV